MTENTIVEINVPPERNLSSTKTYYNLPCAHRQWKHDGNCKVIHGYSRSFRFTFQAHTLDKCGFVVDFGELDWLCARLEHLFDHTLLIGADDPFLPMFKDLHNNGVCNLRIFEEGASTEMLAKNICTFADQNLRTLTKGRCWVVKVEAFENDKNGAVYWNPAPGFRGWL